MTWLILDVHYLCHRAFHTTKELSWDGKPTGVIFGFLKSIGSLKDEFQTDRVAFCFESQWSFRQAFYPPYKQARRNQTRTEEEKEAYKNLVIQIGALREQYLPQIGFKNVFTQYGMESDDLMAAIAFGYPKEDIMLVTGDSDLFQCLRSNVSIYSPHKRMILTPEWFAATYGISPRQWAKVKAIGGCATDGVEGLEGIGEITALKYVRGELPPTSKAYKTIIAPETRHLVRRNRFLVELPCRYCPKPSLVEDHVDPRAWRDVCGQLGMRSIAGHPPVASRKRGMI